MLEAANLVKGFEGYRSKAYLCPSGKWTCGYGHTKGVGPDTKCTQEQAEKWLIEDLAEAYEAVVRRVTVPLNDFQKAALVSFVFNVGERAFTKSTLLAKLNQGDYVGAAAEFGKWVWSRGKKLEGLVRRREAEAALFMAKEGEYAMDGS